MTSRILSVAVTVLLLATSPLHAFTLVGEYLFEDATDLGRDSSGLGNNGVAAASLTQVAGRASFSQAAFFNGSNSNVVIDSLTGYDGLPGFSLTAWVKLASDTSGYDGVISQDTGACCETRLLLSPQHHPYINAHQHADKHLTGATVPLDQWVHLTLTAETTGANATARVYIDGQEVIGSPQFFDVLGSSAGFKTYIGAGEGGTAHPIKGVIDDVRIYDGVLTAEDIRQIMAIPEPATLALLGLGLLAARLRRRTSRR